MSEAKLEAAARALILLPRALLAASDAGDDFGDLDAAILTAARSLHERIIHVGLAETVGTRPSTQEDTGSGPLGIQAAVEKEANF